jgi:hypothetical protein
MSGTQLRDDATTQAAFGDPDGNGWLPQGITERLPGRVSAMDTAPYLDARQRGSTAEQASAAADRYMKELRGVVAPR